MTVTALTEAPLPRPDRGAVISHDVAKIMLWQADVLLKGGFLPKRYHTQAQVLPIFMLADELGIGRMTAIRQMYIIDQKPAIETGLMMALIHRTRELSKLEIEDGTNFCKVTMGRKNLGEMSVTWGDKEAKEAGLFEKENYRKYRRAMYRWRAISEVGRVLFAEVLTGVYTLDELGAPTKVVGTEIVLDEEPAAVDSQPEATVVQQPAAPAPAVRTPTPLDPTPKKNPKLGKKRTVEPAARSVQIRKDFAALLKTIYPDTKALVLSDMERARVTKALADNKTTDYWEKSLVTLRQFVEDRLKAKAADTRGEEPEEEEQEPEEEETEDLDLEGEEEEPEDEDEE